MFLAQMDIFQAMLRCLSKYYGECNDGNVTSIISIGLGFRTNSNFDLTMVIEGKKVIKILKILTVNMNLCNKFHGNPSSSCPDISLKTTNVNLIVVL